MNNSKQFVWKVCWTLSISVFYFLPCGGFVLENKAIQKQVRETTSKKMSSRQKMSLKKDIPGCGHLFPPSEYILRASKHGGKKQSNFRSFCFSQQPIAFPFHCLSFCFERFHLYTWNMSLMYHQNSCCDKSHALAVCTNEKKILRSGAKLKPTQAHLTWTSDMCTPPQTVGTAHGHSLVCDSLGTVKTFAAAATSWCVVLWTWPRYLVRQPTMDSWSVCTENNIDPKYKVSCGVDNLVHFLL